MNVKIKMISSEKQSREKIITDYLSSNPDATLRELGTVLGISRQRVHVLLQELNLQGLMVNRWRELTRHQSDILKHVASGYTDQQVADIMGISAQAIRNRLQVIYAKLKVHKRKDAVQVAIKQGILPKSTVNMK